MLHVVGTPIGIVAGLLLCYYARNSKLVIGKPYSCSDWLVVNSIITMAFIFVMTLEWAIYSALLNNFGELGMIGYLIKKGCLIPFYSCALSFLWGKLVRWKFLDYAEDYSSTTARHCLSLMVAVVCLNIQLILLPGIEDSQQYDFMQDSVIAWALIGIGTIFSLGVGCEGRRNERKSKRVGLQGYGYPILTATGIGLFGLIASEIGLAPLIPSFMLSATVTSLILVTIVRLQRTTLKRFMKQLRKANRQQGYTKRKLRGKYKNIQFCLDGEWLIIDRDDSVKYWGNNKEFDDLFGGYKHRIGTQISIVASIITGRFGRQLKFIEKESKRAKLFPDEYVVANERYARR